MDKIIVATANKHDPVPIETDKINAFLNLSQEAIPNKKQDPIAKQPTPEYRKLTVRIASNGLAAHLDAVFPRTSWDEVRNALVQARVRWGIEKSTILKTLQKAQDTGKVQKNILVARGRPAVYKKRRTITYPFLNDLTLPNSQEKIHLASSLFRKIYTAHTSRNIEDLKTYTWPVVTVAKGTELMHVQGKDEIEPGRDVHGKSITRVEEGSIKILKAGDGVLEKPDGSLVATRYGHVAIQNPFIMILSPIWISSDGLEAYFFDPPKLGTPPPISAKIIERLLHDETVTYGIDHKLIHIFCEESERGTLRESCVLIAKGDSPTQSKGQFRLYFEALPIAKFEKLKTLLQGLDQPEIKTFTDAVTVVSEGTILAENNHNGGHYDVYNKPVAPAGQTKNKIYKAGVNVKKETQDGKTVFISDIYGYAGISNNKLTVLSPLWLSPNKMQASFVALPQGQHTISPTASEIQALLDRAHINFGIKKEVIETLVKGYKTGNICIAEGMRAKPGVDGTVELLFKQMLDPGKMLANDKIDFRERNSIPQAHPHDMLAKRSIPKEGKAGRDVRGRLLKPTKPVRDLLYAGPQVTMKENDGEQVFYATGIGWARVIKDTLSVQQRFKHSGDVDYRIGNIKMKGDVEISGSIKSRFTVETTGDVLVAGTVEAHAHIIAGGNVVVQRGIIKSDVRCEGNLYARYIQESELFVGGDLIVRNNVQESKIQVSGEAIVQGDESGSRNLCVLGGTLFATKGIKALSLGASYGRPTRIITGVDLENEKQLTRYEKGLAFCDLQMRRAARGLGNLNKKDAQHASPQHKQFMTKRLNELQSLRNLRESLTFYISEFKQTRQTVAKKADISIQALTYPKVDLQIGDITKHIDQEIKSTMFSLSTNGDVIAQEAIRA